ncbi:Guanine nucleotide-binding protein subunit gamma-1 [Globodera pallida]|uniref:G protein gamma domain-containing protein n=2 Tax=Globodera TaxID=31242 RepID=A0A914HRR4_GLORO|nr:Guanine nucleotide-binding protein subunit gamma-1 [Globodera pallida]
MDIHSVQQAQNVVEQLKREKNIPRRPMSETINDLIRFTQEMQRDDYLFNGFPTDKMNPYRPKSSFQCLIL